MYRMKFPVVVLQKPIVTNSRQRELWPDRRKIPHIFSLGWRPGSTKTTSDRNLPEAVLNMHG
jgi:hypothetical protein